MSDEKIKKPGFGALGQFGIDRIGLGCDSRDAKILRLAAISPHAALSELAGAIPAPYMFNVPATFDTTDQKIANGSMDADILGGDVWIQQITYDIQVPSAFAGNPQKTMNDFFYNQTSGIAAQIQVTGRPRYDICQGFTPLKNVGDFIGEHWPDGWRLTKENGVKMQFVPTSTLPFAPVSITVTFRGWQYVSPMIDSLSTMEVIAKLEEIGYPVGYLRANRAGT